MDFRFPLCAILALDALSAQSPSFDLTTIPTKATPQSLVVGYFNRDGKSDLAVSGIDGSGNGTVEILLGNGDGSFRSVGVIPVGSHASRIVKVEFNNDGNLDLAVCVGVASRIFCTSSQVGADRRDSCWNTRGAMIEVATPAGHQPLISAGRKNERSDEAQVCTTGLGGLPGPYPRRPACHLVA